VKDHLSKTELDLLEYKENLTSNVALTGEELHGALYTVILTLMEQ
jgi:hypothetical protein